jgi:hypothetical protein
VSFSWQSRLWIAKVDLDVEGGLYLGQSLYLSVEQKSAEDAMKLVDEYFVNQGFKLLSENDPLLALI